MRSPIGLYLTDFSKGPSPVLVPDTADLALVEPDDPNPLAALTDAGFDDLPPRVTAMDCESPHVIAAEPESDVSEIVAALQADHASALAEARRQWVAAEGEALARSFSEALLALEERLADTLAPLLERFLVQAAQLEALEQLRDAVRTLLAVDAKQTIQVVGPADLLGALDAAYPGEPRLTYAVADTPDVTVTLADTTVRSRLQAWASILETSLGDHA